MRSGLNQARRPQTDARGQLLTSHSPVHTDEEPRTGVQLSGRAYLVCIKHWVRSPVRRGKRGREREKREI